MDGGPAVRPRLPARPDPRRVRQEDVEVARATASTRWTGWSATAPTRCGSRCRAARTPVGHVHRRGVGGRFAQLRHQAVQRHPVRADERRDGGPSAARPRRADRRRPLDPRPARRGGVRRGRHFEAYQFAKLPARRSTTSRGTSSATGTWSWRRSSSPRAARAEATQAVLGPRPRRRAAAAAPGDAVRHRDAVEDADRRRVAGRRRVADSRPVRTRDDDAAAHGSRTCRSWSPRSAGSAATRAVKPGQKVPAQGPRRVLRGLVDQVPAVPSLAWLTEPGDEFTVAASLEVGLPKGTVHGRARHVRHGRRGRRAQAAREGPGRRARRSSRSTDGQARQRGVPRQGARRRRRQDPRPARRPPRPRSSGSPRASPRCRSRVSTVRHDDLDESPRRSRPARPALARDQDRADTATGSRR